MIYIVSDKYSFTEINPITNEKYNSRWIAFQLTDSDAYQIAAGGGSKSVYSLKVSKKYPHWKMCLMDFIEFQTNHKKNIILSVNSDDLEEAKSIYDKHHFNEPCLREYEPKVLIHSTTIDYWEKIKKDNCLKSWNKLKKENQVWEELPIGRYLGDPEDFSDYIMFSGGDISSELVVLSKQNGKIITDQDMYYTPGVRLYFDIEMIAKDGLLIRDGYHLKVKDSLPLKRYLIWVADCKSVCLSSVFITPSEFTTKSNNLFNELFGEKYSNVL